MCGIELLKHGTHMEPADSPVSTSEECLEQQGVKTYAAISVVSIGVPDSVILG